MSATSDTAVVAHMGAETYEVPASMHAVNRGRLVAKMRDAGADGVALFKGGESVLRHDTDHEPVFRQESFFAYVTGVREPDCWAMVDLDEEATTTLFIPRLPAEYAVWMGPIEAPHSFQQRYAVHHVRYVDELDAVLAERAPPTVYRLQGLNTDSGATFQAPEWPTCGSFKCDDDLMHPLLVECRVIKTPAELDLMRYVNRISSAAHREVMRRMKPGLMEYQMEALFQYYCYYYGGGRHCPYTCICGSGINAAVLHYGHAGAANDKAISDGEMCMFDMGSEYHFYGSDISCSFPCNGKFTQVQREVYEAVLAARNAVLEALRPGVTYPDMHLLSERVMLTKLAEAGFVKGSVDQMMEYRIGALFQPHGLGHFLGIDTHDVGGYPNGAKRSDKPGLKSLRMVVTVEPGCYFIRALLEPALEDPMKSAFLVADKVRSCFNFGGVRIEDDVIVTETGCENMTDVPRTVEDIEALMAENPTPL